jgi:DNA-binding transcriptional ArsR family regulator
MSSTCRDHSELFLKGPVPVKWLNRASELRGKAPLKLGLALWFQAGLRRSAENIRLTKRLRRQFGIKDRSVYNALAALESEGLISADRKRGRYTRVSLIDSDREKGVSGPRELHHMPPSNLGVESPPVASSPSKEPCEDTPHHDMNERVQP